MDSSSMHTFQSKCQDRPNEPAGDLQPAAPIHAAAIVHPPAPVPTPAADEDLTVYQASHNRIIEVNNARKRKLTLLMKAHELHKSAGAQVYLMIFDHGHYTIYESKTAPTWPTRQKELNVYHPTPVTHTGQEFDAIPRRYWGILKPGRRSVNRAVYRRAMRNGAKDSSAGKDSDEDTSSAAEDSDEECHTPEEPCTPPPRLAAMPITPPSSASYDARRLVLGQEVEEVG
ncbi:hypothetical protein F5Y18DRAFT_54100 [Xylariaceae sp. FL1019]|nr:hypothetical protein F5Y18DRAFT_54100 [Xylariaceae sp. FL1019]